MGLVLLLTASLNTAPTLAADSFDDLFGMDPAAEESSEPELRAEPESADDLFGFSDEPSSSTGAPPELDGFLLFESAYTYESPSHLSKALTTLELASSGSLDNGIKWKLSGRGTYDAAFEFTDHYPGEVRDNRDLQARIQEAYLDIGAGDLELRLGRQQIIWGEMVGLFFADVVSAKDLRQFVAQDFDLIRIPQWAARAEYFGDEVHAEVIWIPYMTYNEIGKPGDDFYPLSLTPPPGFSLQINNVDTPSRDISNSAFGVRGSLLRAGWDLSAFYYRSVNADPVYFIEASLNPAPVLEVSPEHTRIHQFGATLAKDLGQVVLKSEAVYTKDSYLNTEDLSGDRGAIQQDYLDYIVALEHTTPDNTLLNFQFYQRWYPDHDNRLIFDEWETGVSFYGKMELSSRLDAEVTLISQLNRSDWMARPRVIWEFKRNWEVQMGADLFHGNAQGLFGRFENSSRVYTNLRYSF